MAPKYTGPDNAGFCLCGHPWTYHHLGIVLNPHYYNETGEEYVPQECERYGFNEHGGFGPDGNNHCQQYVDCGAGHPLLHLLLTEEHNANT